MRKLEAEKTQEDLEKTDIMMNARRIKLMSETFKMLLKLQTKRTGCISLIHPAILG